MTRRPKVSERLLERIRQAFPDLDIPEGARLERVVGAARGANRTEGAWVWTVCRADGVPVCNDSQGHPLAIGSQWTMTELVGQPLAANPDLYGDIVIEPTDEVQRKIREGKRKD